MMLKSKRVLVGFIVFFVVVIGCCIPVLLSDEKGSLVDNDEVTVHTVCGTLEQFSLKDGRMQVWLLQNGSFSKKLVFVVDVQFEDLIAMDESVGEYLCITYEEHKGHNMITGVCVE